MTLLQCSLLSAAVLVVSGWLLVGSRRPVRSPSTTTAPARQGLQAIDRARALEQRLRELALDSSTNGISIVELSNGEPAFTYVNETFSAITGYSRAEMIGRHPRLLHRQDTQQQGLVDMAEAIRTGRPCSVRLRNYRKSGEMFWNQLSVRPVRASGGAVTHYIGVQTDISQSVLAEQALRQRTDRLNAVFDLSPDGFVVLDEEDFVSLVNPAFERLTGLRADELVGRHVQILEALLRKRCVATPGAAGASKPPFVDTLPSGAEDKVAALAPPAEVFRLLPPQSRILLRRVRQGAYGEGDTVISFRDITRESEMDRMKTEFLSTAAHELRTPMTSIFGFAELLLRHDFEESRRREIVTTIHRQTGLLVNLVNELLDLARIESRRGEALEKKVQPLMPIVANVVAAVKGSHPQRRIHTHSAAGPLWVEVDASRLELALTNVLSNACKYSAEDTDVDIDFVDRSRHGAREIGVRVSDRGIGMTEAQLSRIFERFYRADPAGKVPGTGLGMAIAKEMIDLHGGELTVWSDHGQGTRVTMWLPLKASPRGAHPIGRAVQGGQIEK